MSLGSIPNEADPVTRPPETLADAQRALRASIEREAILRSELARRLRNLLSVTRSVFTRTMETADTLEHASDHFLGRLDAMSRYHVLPASVLETGLDLESMLYDELLVFRSADDPRVLMAGPEVRLKDRLAETLGLAFHELVANAIKFGALAPANAGGRLHISWSAAPDLIDLAWIESGVPIVASLPMAPGFGQRYIEHALPYQLGAETDFRIVAGGLQCRIRLPLLGPPEGSAVPG